MVGAHFPAPPDGPCGWLLWVPSSPASLPSGRVTCPELARIRTSERAHVSFALCHPLANAYWAVSLVLAPVLQKRDQGLRWPLSKDTQGEHGGAETGAGRSDCKQVAVAPCFQLLLHTNVGKLSWHTTAGTASRSGTNSKSHSTTHKYLCAGARDRCRGSRNSGAENGREMRTWIRPSPSDWGTVIDRS